LQLVAVALCAWGIIVILEILAFMCVALFDSRPVQGSTSLGYAMLAAWAVLFVQLLRSLVWPKVN